VTDLSIGEFYEIDFCSKISHSVDGTIANWHFTRDPLKVLQTKQYVTSSNLQLLKNPFLHRKAIYEGFRSEKVSKLVEDMLLVQMSKLPV